MEEGGREGEEARREEGREGGKGWTSSWQVELLQGIAIQAGDGGCLEQGGGSG